MPNLPTLVDSLLSTELAQSIQSHTHGRDIWLVGGALRDHFLDLEQPDLDFAIDEGAIPFARRLADGLDTACYVLDEKRDAARVILPDRATLDFARLRAPGIEADLKLRDFTVNALGLNLNDPERLIDPLGGLQDINDRVLRACTPQSIDDDPIRTMRAVRLSSSLMLQIEDRTVDLIRSSAPKLSESAAERRRDELSKMLEAKRVATALRLMRRLELLPQVLPEQAALPPVAWKAALRIVDRLVEVIGAIAEGTEADRDGNLPMAELSLRIGRFRPQLSEHLATELKGGHQTRLILYLAAAFVGQEGAQQSAYARARDLRYSDAEAVRVRSILESQERARALNGELSDLDAHRYFHKFGGAGIEGALLCLAELYARSPTQDVWESKVLVVRQLLSAWFEDHARVIDPPQLLPGDELASALEIQAGPELGALLKGIAEGQVEGSVHNREEAIQHARRLLEDR